MDVGGEWKSVSGMNSKHLRTFGRFVLQLITAPPELVFNFSRLYWNTEWNTEWHGEWFLFLSQRIAEKIESIRVQILITLHP